MNSNCNPAMKMADSDRHHRSCDWDDKAKAGQSEQHPIQSLGTLEMSQAWMGTITHCTMHDIASC